MPASSSIRPSSYLVSIAQTARTRPWLWALPLVLCTLMVGLYAFVMPRSWNAVQAFAIREELIGREFRPGRFDSLDEMKTAQETITEVARNTNVLERTLARAGLKASQKDIESFQDAISFAAPNGAEFGKTEILLLTVKNRRADRAKQLVTFLFEELEVELRRIRKARADSMVRELELASSLAKTQLDQAANRLQQLEESIGEHLPDLRSLNDPQSSSGTLINQLNQVRSELRPATVELETLTRQQENLSKVIEDSEEILGTPSELLALQPALRRLKDGLIDAQLNLSKVTGRYRREHPKTLAANRSVDDIKDRIQKELTIVLSGLETQITVSKNKIANLQERETAFSRKLDELAGLRVHYGDLNDEYMHRRQTYGNSLAELEKAQSIRKAAAEVDLIQKVDEPFVGSRPSGPGKSSMILGGLVGGVCLGSGLILLFTPNPPPSGNPIRPNPPNRNPHSPAQQQPSRESSTDRDTQPRFSPTSPPTPATQPAIPASALESTTRSVQQTGEPSSAESTGELTGTRTQVTEEPASSGKTEFVIPRVPATPREPSPTQSQSFAQAVEKARSAEERLGRDQTMVDSKEKNKPHVPKPEPNTNSNAKRQPVALHKLIQDSKYFKASSTRPVGTIKKIEAEELTQESSNQPAALETETASPVPDVGQKSDIEKSTPLLKDDLDTPRKEESTPTSCEDLSNRETQSSKLSEDKKEETVEPTSEASFDMPPIPTEEAVEASPMDLELNDLMDQALSVINVQSENQDEEAKAKLDPESLDVFAQKPDESKKQEFDIRLPKIEEPSPAHNSDSELSEQSPENLPTIDKSADLGPAARKASSLADVAKKLDNIKSKRVVAPGQESAESAVPVFDAKNAYPASSLASDDQTAIGSEPDLPAPAKSDDVELEIEESELDALKREVERVLQTSGQSSIESSATSRAKEESKQDTASKKIETNPVFVLPELPSAVKKESTSDGESG